MTIIGWVVRDKKMPLMLPTVYSVNHSDISKISLRNCVLHFNSVQIT